MGRRLCRPGGWTAGTRRQDWASGPRQLRVRLLQAEPLPTWLGAEPPPVGAAPEALAASPPCSPPARGPHVIAVDVAVGQHHGRVVLVHHVARDLADQARVGAVGHGQRLRQLVQRAAAHRAVGALGAAVPLVALPVPGQGSVGVVGARAGRGQGCSLPLAQQEDARKAGMAPLPARACPPPWDITMDTREAAARGRALALCWAPAAGDNHPPVTSRPAKGAWRQMAVKRPTTRGPEGRSGGAVPEGPLQPSQGPRPWGYSASLRP